ncbi:MAG TPA: HAD-IA family hydrolase [Vicinamibacterales bacterium]|nr:HAD-IA family hydrolase [Vicinamibacterales bacterium]
MAVTTLTRRRKPEAESRKPSAVLIDLDDTLFDHRASARRALESAAACDPVLGAVAFDTLEARHRLILEDLHRRVLDGHITVDQARAMRFRTLIEEQGDTCDDPRLDRITAAYRAAYQSGWACLAGARDLLAELKRREARIAIVTNNVVSEQVAKLKRLEIDTFVDALVVSEAVGISKPAAGIFSHALAELGAAAGDAVMIGDSWSADIEGARGAGLRAVWFNPRRAPRPAGRPEVAEIESLEPAGEVADVVLGRT